MSASSDWIKQRLPGDAEFSKNGVTVTVASAVDSALDDHSSSTGVVTGYPAYVKAGVLLALADLLEILDANVEFEAEKVGDGSYSRPRFADRIAILREQAVSQENTPPGAFQNATARFGPTGTTDEYSGSV